MQAKDIKKRWKLFLKTKELRIFSVTAVIIAILAIFIGNTIVSVNEMVLQTCFDNLATTSKELGAKLRAAVDLDTAVLSAMGNMISNRPDMDEEELCQVMNSFDYSVSYLSYVELLRPDGTMLDSDGTVRDVSNQIDFATEAGKGKYISTPQISTKDSSVKVIRNGVPVIKDGKAIYILLGVTTEESLAEKFTTNIYDGNATIFLMDGDTGNFILDTWHDQLGNVEDFKERKLLKAYSWDTALNDMKEGKSGKIALVSEKIDEVIYIHYEPTQINNFNVLVMTEREVALGESKAVRNRLYTMAIVIGVVMFLYMAGLTIYLLKAYKQVKKLGNEDQYTGLLNRNAYEQYVQSSHQEVFEHITCLYIDVNGLHEVNNIYGHEVGDKMLRLVADTLSDKFKTDQVYRIGGDEFVVLGLDPDKEKYELKIKEAKDIIEKHDYSISYGIKSYENEKGLNRIIRETDELMLKQKRAYYKAHDRRRG